MKNKKAFIDYIIEEDEDSQIIFRFLPYDSRCHSFGDNPPTCWKDVYKVYYAYRIIEVDKEDPNCNEVLFDCPFDECSIIDEVAARCLLLTEGKRTVTVTHPREHTTHEIELLNNRIQPFGDGIQWEIREAPNKEWYDFILFNWRRMGYHFYIHVDKIKEFGLFLQECCEYMLAHGDPI